MVQFRRVNSLGLQRAVAQLAKVISVSLVVLTVAIPRDMVSSAIPAGDVRHAPGQVATPNEAMAAERLHLVAGDVAGEEWYEFHESDEEESAEERLEARARAHYEYHATAGDLCPWCGIDRLVIVCTRCCMSLECNGTVVRPRDSTCAYDRLWCQCSADEGSEGDEEDADGGANGGDGEGGDDAVNEATVADPPSGGSHTGTARAVAGFELPAGSVVELIDSEDDSEARA